MPAALKTPLLEPDFAPDNWNTSALAKPSSRPAPASVSGASARPALSQASAARAASPARISPREREQNREPSREEERQAAARPLRSRPVARPQDGVAEEVATALALKRERKHRPFRLTVTATLCGCALMGQLVMLLWLHGKTLTSAREVEKMDTQIAEVSNQIERTQERIAAFDSSPQIKQWAQEKGWRPAAHPDIDDITHPDQARAQADTAAAASAPDGDKVEAQ